MYEDATPITESVEPPEVEITEAADMARFRVADVNPTNLPVAPVAAPVAPQGESLPDAEADKALLPELSTIPTQESGLAFDTYEPEVPLGSTAGLALEQVAGTSEGLANNGE